MFVPRLPWQFVMRHWTAQTQAVFSQGQRALTKAVLALGKPTTIVVINGGAVSLAEEKAAGAAILEAYEPGKHGAGAVADVILGSTSPAGRLIYTVRI